MTNPIISPVADGWILRCGKEPIGPFKSFRDAQLEMQKLYGRQEFARRFPVTADVIFSETHDRKPGGSSCLICGRVPCRCSEQEAA